MKQLIFAAFLIFAFISCSKETMKPPGKITDVPVTVASDLQSGSPFLVYRAVANWIGNEQDTYKQELIYKKAGAYNYTDSAGLHTVGHTADTAARCQGDGIWFGGNSKHNYWLSLESSFYNLPVYLRALGGSLIRDNVRLIQNDWTCYKPAIGFFTHGENEFRQFLDTSGTQVFNEYINMLLLYHAASPKTQIVVLQPQLSPAMDSIYVIKGKRVSIRNEFHTLDTLLAKWVPAHSDWCTYMTTLTPLVYEADGYTCKESMYRPDRMHPNVDYYTLAIPKYRAVIDSLKRKYNLTFARL